MKSVVKPLLTLLAILTGTGHVSLATPLPAAARLSAALEERFFGAEGWSEARIQVLIQKLESLSPLFRETFASAERNLGRRFVQSIRACEPRQSFANPWSPIRTDYTFHRPPLTDDLPSFSAEKRRFHEAAFEIVREQSETIAWVHAIAAPSLCLPLSLSRNEMVIALSHLVGVVAHDRPVHLLLQILSADSLETGLEVLTETHKKIAFLKNIAEHAYIQDVISALNLPRDELGTIDSDESQWIDYSSETVIDATAYNDAIVAGPLAQEIRSRWQNWVNEWVRDQAPARSLWMVSVKARLEEIRDQTGVPEAIEAVNRDLDLIQKTQCTLLNQLIELHPAHLERNAALFATCRERFPVAQVPETQNLPQLPEETEQESEPHRESETPETQPPATDPTSVSVVPSVTPLRTQTFIDENGIDWTPPWD